MLIPPSGEESVVISYGILDAKVQNFFQTQHIMDKILTWLKTSNRYKHLIGGFIVGLLALSPYAAIYTAAVAASCLELKDKLHGCLWDWLDWILTLIGGATAALLWTIL